MRAIRRDDCYELILPSGHVALVDHDDYPAIAGFAWHVNRKKHTSYVEAQPYRDGRQTTVCIHRIIMGASGDEEVDHRDGDGLNNRRYNLRRCTSSQNQFNKRTFNAHSKFKGVHPSQSKKNPWRVQLCANGKKVYLGGFPTEELAASAYNEASAKFHGEFSLPFGQR